MVEGETGEGAVTAVGARKTGEVEERVVGRREGRMEKVRVGVLGRKALGLKAAWRADEKILDILTAGCVVVVTGTGGGGGG